MKFFALAAALLLVSQEVRASDAPPELVMRLREQDDLCQRGDVRACGRAQATMGELSSHGFCYGRPSDTLPWERRKTGWVRCGR